MNNWRLLLLALVAVFQPITSFTERNFVDGRQECCDRQTDTLVRDSRPYLHETNRLAKPSSHPRRLNYRDETREEDRQLRQRFTLFSRRSMKRSLLDIQERNRRQSPSIISWSARIEFRTNRIASDDNGERELDGLRKERNTLTRVSMIQRNVKTNDFSSRHMSSRINRRSNDRQDREMSQKERIEIRSGNLRRLTPTRSTRDSLWMDMEAVDRVRVSRDSRQVAEREMVHVVLREPISHDKVRRYLDINNERRDHEHRVEPRRSLSENSIIVERVRDMNIRANSRDKRQENRERLAVSRQDNNDRRKSMESVRDHTDLRVSGERMHSDRRDIRASRLMNERNIQYEAVESRRVMKQAERLSKETRDDQFVQGRRVESRASRRMTERDIRVTEQRARSRDLQTFRSTRSDSPLNRFAEIVRDSDASGRYITYRNKMANGERDAVDVRFRNDESVRIRDNSIMINKFETENETIGNWQYVFYSVQAAYLCGLVIQMLTPNRNEKSKMRNLHWWPTASQRLMKVD